MKAAVYTSLYSSSLIGIPDPPYSCSSGNCTWNNFPTLAVPAQCFDDSDNFQLNCSNPALEPWPGYNFTACALEAKDPLYRSGDPASSHKVFESDGSYRDGAPYLDRNAHCNNPNFEYGFPGSPESTTTSLDSGFTVFKWQAARNLTHEFNTRTYDSSLTSSSTLEAGMCIIYLSMDVIHAQVRNGEYSENIVTSTTEVSIIQEPNSYNHSLSDGILVFTYTPACQDMAKAELCSLGDKKVMELKLSTTTHVNLIASIAKNLPTGNLTTLHESGLSGQATSESLYRSPNINETMHQIANYVNIALHSPDFITPSHSINGTVYIHAVHLEVRWGWLALPATLSLIVAG
jgi:hypothetical protein